MPQPEPNNGYGVMMLIGNFGEAENINVGPFRNKGDAHRWAMKHKVENYHLFEMTTPEAVERDQEYLDLIHAVDENA